MTKVFFLRNVVKTVAVLVAVTVMTACSGGSSNKSAAQQSDSKKTTEAVTPAKGSNTEIKDVDENNWQKVIKANYGIDLKLPEDWSFKEVSTLNGVSNVKLFLTIGGGETGESFGKKLFETTKTLSPHGNYKSRVNLDANTVEADNTISDFNSANAGSATDIIAKWNYTFNGRMVQLNYYANRNTAEYTFNLN